MLDVLLEFIHYGIGYVHIFKHAFQLWSELATTLRLLMTHKEYEMTHDTERKMYMKIEHFMNIKQTASALR